MKKVSILALFLTLSFLSPFGEKLQASYLDDVGDILDLTIYKQSFYVKKIFFVGDTKDSISREEFHKKLDGELSQELEEKTGRSVFHWIAYLGKKEFIEYFFDYENKINYSLFDKDGLTQLHHAFRDQDISFIKEIIEKCPEQLRLKSKNAKNREPIFYLLDDLIKPDSFDEFQDDVLKLRIKLLLKDDSISFIWEVLLAGEEANGENNPEESLIFAVANIRNYLSSLEVEEKYKKIYLNFAKKLREKYEEHFQIKFYPYTSNLEDLLMSNLLQNSSCYQEPLDEQRENIGKKRKAKDDGNPEKKKKKVEKEKVEKKKVIRKLIFT